MWPLRGCASRAASDQWLTQLAELGRRSAAGRHARRLRLLSFLTVVLVCVAPHLPAEDTGKAPAAKAEREARARKAADDAVVKKAAEEHKARREKDAQQGAAAKEEKKAPKLDDDALLEKLQAKTSIQADKLPLKDFVQELSKMHSVPIKLDERALRKAEVAVDAPVTVFFTNLTLERTIKLALKDLGLKQVDLSISDGAITVAGSKTAEEADVQAAPAIQRKAIRAAARPAVAVMGVDPQAQQFIQQYKPVLLAELHFIRTICQPGAEQMKGIAEQGDKILQTAAVQFADLQRGVRRKVKGQAAPSPNTEPHWLIRDTLAAAAKMQLTDEQMTRLEEENARRRREHVETVVHSLVARLDQDLFLSDKQREEIGQSLTENWQDAWCPSLDMWLFNDMAFPNVPDKYVLRFLTDAQKKIWRGIPKAQMGVGNFGGNIWRMMPNDEKLWEEDDEPEGAKE